MTGPMAVDRKGLDEFVDVPLEHHYLPRWWGTQHIVEAGTRGAPVAVLLHGWPEHWFAYRHVLRALAGELNLFAIDTRGFGWSAVKLDARARRAVRADSLASDVVFAMDQLGIERAHLVGHDWGGWFAFQAALDHPDRFKTLTAMAIMPPWLDAAQVARHLTGLAYLGPMAVIGDWVARSPGLVRGLLRKSTADQRVWRTVDGETAAKSYVDRLAPAESGESTRLLYRRMVAVEFRRACGTRPPRLQMPASIVLGSKEQISHPDLFSSRSEPGELAVHRVPRAGHWLLDETPEAVIDHLRRTFGLNGAAEPPSGDQGTANP